MELTAEVCSDRHMDSVSERVRALRTKLKLTQMDVAARSGGLLDQGRVAKIESGRNKMSTRASQLAMAKGLGLSPSDFDAYLDGSLPIVDAVARAKGATPPPGPRVERESAPGDTDGSPFGDSLSFAFDAKAGHRPEDMDSVRRAIKRPRAWAKENVDLVKVLRACLDAARDLRLEGKVVDSDELMLRLAAGRGAVAESAHAGRVASGRAAIDALTTAGDASLGDELGPVDPKKVAQRKATAAKGARRGREE